jgi:RnfABCDGE-type electron transport complex B subunit
MSAIVLAINFGNVITATLMVGVVGLLIGLLLGVTGHVFRVEIDPKQEAIRACLPGNNCGGCGYPGCDGLAAAIFAGEAPVNQCPVGGAPVAAKIAEVMGVEADAVPAAEGKKAFVKCKGDNDTAVLNEKGRKVCTYGCIACGLCVRQCQFDAIHVENGVAVVDRDKCVGCGACAAKCPKKIIELVPESKTHVVACSNPQFGKDVTGVCKAGCIGCGICVKNCESQAIAFAGEDKLPVIDYEKCVNCGVCATKCPKKVIS